MAQLQKMGAIPDSQRTIRVMSMREVPASIVRWSIDRGLRCVADVGYRLPVYQPSRYGVQLIKNVAYRPTGLRDHELDIYIPPGRGPHPAIMYVHGGAFSMLSKDTHRVMALSFARRGFVVFNINYRLAPKTVFPGPLEDVCQALIWVKDHCARYGADPERLAIAGESAGGNLVTALAYITTHPRPEWFAVEVFRREINLRAVLAVYGLLDVADVDRFWRGKQKYARTPFWLREAIRDAAVAYIGTSPDPSLDLALASPLRCFEAEPLPGSRPLPPFFATAGTKDPLLDDSRRLQSAIVERGGECELMVYPGEIHGFNAMTWRKAAKGKWGAAYTFLMRHCQ